MLKPQSILVIACNVRNKLLKTNFRNFSQTVRQSKVNTYSTSVGYKCLLQKASIFSTTPRSLLSKLASVSLTKDSTSAESFLDGVIDIEDAERRNELLQIIKLLISHQCSDDEIKKTCLPYIISTQSSYFKVKLLADLHFNIAMLMPLLSCHIISLRAAAKHARQDIKNIEGFPNRIEYLSHNLEIKSADLIPMLSKHPSLLTMPFKRLNHKMTILKQAQIESEYIVKDLWIFNYNEKLLEERISAALKAKVEVKPWMLRCSEKVFESVLIKWVKTQDILKGEAEVSYLAKKLDCTEDYVTVMMERNKLLKTINIPKIEQILSFLYDKGYTPQEVRLFPRVFCSSVQTLSERFEEFRKLKTTLPTMSQLCISTKKLESTRRKKSSSGKKESKPNENQE